MSKPIRIGLTGGIACGKSTVSSHLRKMNIPVLDADQVARDVVAVGSPVLGEITEYFGSDILLDNGSLNRIALRNIIIQNPEAKRVLESITHPRIFEGMRLWQQAQESLDKETTVVEAALMVESGSYQTYDAIIVVACHRDTQISRLMKRNQIDQNTAVQWIESQMSLQEKIAVSDWTIWNDGSIEQLRATVCETWDLFVSGLLNK